MSLSGSRLAQTELQIELSRLGLLFHLVYYELGAYELRFLLWYIMVYVTVKQAAGRNGFNLLSLFIYIYGRQSQARPNSFAF